jgi:hypothetical protein
MDDTTFPMHYPLNVHLGQKKFSSDQIFVRLMKSPRSIYMKKRAIESFDGNFLRRIRDVYFAGKQIEKDIQGVRTMMTLSSCSPASYRREAPIGGLFSIKITLTGFPFCKYLSRT